MSLAPRSHALRLAALAFFLLLGLLVMKPAGQVAATSYIVHPNLGSLADQATHIVYGTVGETITTGDRDTPVRGRPGHVVSTIRVQEVLKGEVEGERITVGEVDAMSTLEQPDGTVVVFFLKKVDPDAPSTAAEPSPYGYFNVSGPQGRYIVEEGRIVPQGPHWAETTTRYEGMTVDEFLTEVRKVLGTDSGDAPVGQTSSGSLAWGAGVSALLTGLGGMAFAFVRRR